MELASAGVSISIFNIVSKLFNIPLLSVATSFVAEDIAKNLTKDLAAGEYKRTIGDFPEYAFISRFMVQAEIWKIQYLFLHSICLTCVVMQA